MRILLVEDDTDIAEAISHFFRKNYVIDSVSTGESCIFNALSYDYDAIILDVGLPDICGLQLCSDLRNEKIFCPIIFLSADARITSKVTGLNAGADDYVTKPFSFSELDARIHALLRRKEKKYDHEIRVGELILNTTSREAYYKEKYISLCKREYNMLEFLIRNKNIVLSKYTIMEHVWDDHEDCISNTFDVHLNRIRKKLIKNNCCHTIETIRGVGYVIRDSLKNNLNSNNILIQ